MAQMQPTAGGKVEALSNVTYDLVTVLSNCGEAVDALDDYIDDARRENDSDVVQLFEKIRQDEINHCNMAKGLIENLVKQGKF
ncbi:MAG TPA: hypothetical protein VNL16_11350 [Chloroflexota bacterium]|nr:hypothetical protein [Chloroflexota bacterium]